jgi:signal transduction histidine kinase
VKRYARLLLDAAAGSPATAAPVLPWSMRPGWRRMGVLALGIGLALGMMGEAIPHLMTRGVTPGLATVIGLIEGGPLLLAVRWPLAAWRVELVGLVLNLVALSTDRPVWPWTVGSWIILMILLLQVALAYPRRVVVAVGVLTAVLAVLPASFVDGTPFWLALIIVGIVAVPLLLGDAIRGRRAAETQLAEQTELRRHDLARQAVLEERGRIARELHDVVAHHMSMIAIQAEAAPLKIGGLPPEAADTLAAIRTAAREALAETRRVVGLLRDGDEDVERVPQPGLARLDDLVTAATSAGLAVQPAIIGVPRQLPAGMDVSAYRIVQEALSNAARYAPGARVRVEVRYGSDLLGLSIVDSGGPGPAADSDGGHGLVGMRERVAMLGGSLTAGRRDQGGFEVVAELPYGDGVAAP